MVNRTAHGRPALRLVVAPELEPAPPSVWFCSHCGARSSTSGKLVKPPVSRVCGACGLGLLIEAAEDVAPRTGDAFLVLDRALSVCAVSHGAEQLLATREPDVVNRHVTDLLMPADAEEEAGENLSVAVAWAARGDSATRTTVVRPANTFGIRLTARIAPCGPQRAALVVLE